MKDNIPTKKLGEIIELTKQERVGSEQDTPIMSITMGLGLVDQSDKFKERVASRDISNYKKVKKNELVIGFPIDEGVLGFQKKYDYAAVSPAYNVWKIKNGDADMRFLEYFMRSDFARNIYRSKMVWTTERRRFIPRKQFLSIPIPFPKKYLQKQIVERLDKIAEAQKLNDDLTQKADELFQSLLYNEYELKSNQWGLKKLQEVCEDIEQTHPKKIFKREFSYIDIASINDDGVIRAQITSVDKAPSRARKVVKTGDTIFSTVRPYLKHIAFIPEMLNNSIASTGFCVIRPDTDLTDPLFINYVVESDHFVKKVLPFQRGANYPAVSDKNVYGIKISRPPLATQKQIVAKLSAAQDYKKQLLEQKAKLKELFDSALHKSMETQRPH